MSPQEQEERDEQHHDTNDRYLLWAIGLVLLVSVVTLILAFSG